MNSSEAVFAVHELSKSASSHAPSYSETSFLNCCGTSVLFIRFFDWSFYLLRIHEWDCELNTETHLQSVWHGFSSRGRSISYLLNCSHVSHESVQVGIVIRFKYEFLFHRDDGVIIKPARIAYTDFMKCGMYAKIWHVSVLSQYSLTSMKLMGRGHLLHCATLQFCAQRKMDPTKR